MKKFMKSLICAGLLFLIAAIPGMQVRAEEEENKIIAGIYIEEIPLEGKTASEARALVEEYVESISEKVITLVTVGGNEVQVTPSSALTCIPGIAAIKNSSPAQIRLFINFFIFHSPCISQVNLQYCTKPQIKIFLL